MISFPSLQTNLLDPTHILLILDQHLTTLPLQCRLHPLTLIPPIHTNDSRLQNSRLLMDKRSTMRTGLVL